MNKESQKRRQKIPKTENYLLFQKLNEDGNLSNVRKIKQSNIEKCEFYILLPEHYRQDGSCKCSNKKHRAKMIKDWEYKESDFSDIKIID